MRQPPAYVGKASPHDLERAYAGREVIYLLGMLDNDPHHRELDTSCMGEAQGPDRHAREVAYMRYLRERHHGPLNHRLWEVPGVGHHGAQMLGSACGLATLYGGSPLGKRCER